MLPGSLPIAQDDNIGSDKVLQEIREVASSLRRDAKSDVERILDAIQKLSLRVNGDSSSALRSAAAPYTAHSWVSSEHLPVRLGNGCAERPLNKGDVEAPNDVPPPLPSAVVDATESDDVPLTPRPDDQPVEDCDENGNHEEAKPMNQKVRKKKSTGGFGGRHTVNLKDDEEGSKGRARIGLSREKAKMESKDKKKSMFRLMSIREFIVSPLFDNITGFTILLNAAVIGVQTDHCARNLTDKIPLPFEIFELIFAFWFTFELLLRIHVHRCGFWKPFVDGWLWNYFDTLVVSAQLVEVFFELIRSAASVDAKNIRVLRVLRILRLVRILRVVRVLHLISELRAIVSSIAGSFRSLVWVVVLLLIMMYVVAVFFTQSLTDHLVDAKDSPNFKMTEDEAELYKYFGSLARGILSLWQAMSGGMDWDTLAGPLFREVSFITGFAFASFIAFALLALMNVVTGVFVQTALLSARDEEDAFMVSQIVELFKLQNKEHGARITWDDVLDSLEDPKTAKEWKSIGVEATDARYLFHLLDLDSSGEVPFEEFMGGALRLSGDAKAIDLLTVMQESRKNEDEIQKRFDSLTRSVTQVQEAINVLAAGVFRRFEGIAKDVDTNTEELASLSYMLGKELASMKDSMKPIGMLEDVFTGGIVQHSSIDC